MECKNISHATNLIKEFKDKQLLSGQDLTDVFSLRAIIFNWKCRAEELSSKSKLLLCEIDTLLEAEKSKYVDARIKNTHKKDDSA